MRTENPTPIPPRELPERHLPVLVYPRFKPQPSDGPCYELFQEVWDIAARAQQSGNVIDLDALVVEYGDEWVSRYLDAHGDEAPEVVWPWEQTVLAALQLCRRSFRITPWEPAA